MTASDCSPGNGHESGGCTAQSDDFENWARKELAARISVLVEDAAAPARDEIADAVRDGESVDPSDLRVFRQQLLELFRAIDGALLASDREGCPDRETTAGRVHDHGDRVHDAALRLDRLVLNEEPIETRDIQMIRQEIDQLQQAVDDVVRCYQGYDK
jgi:hypothetical protein